MPEGSAVPYEVAISLQPPSPSSLPCYRYGLCSYGLRRFVCDVTTMRSCNDSELQRLSGRFVAERLLFCPLEMPSSAAVEVPADGLSSYGLSSYGLCSYDL